MDGEARVAALVGGDHGVFWLRIEVNGREIDSDVIHVNSIRDGETAAKEVEEVIKSVYRRAYADGVRDTQIGLRRALGMS